MRSMLDDVDSVVWAGLRHAYGDASDVPGHLRAVASPGRGARSRAVGRLEAVLEHQGTVYSATAAAVPFLCELLVASEPGTRVRMLALLRRIVQGAGFLSQHAGAVVVREGSPEELEAERRFVADAREAVLAGVAAYLSAVADADRAVRANAAYLVAALPERADTIVPALVGRLDVEDDPVVRVCLVLALGELASRARPYPGQVVAVLAALLDAENLDLRAAAAVALRWQGDRAEQPARVLPVLARSLGAKLPVLAEALWVEDDPDDLIAEAMGTDLGENLPLVREALGSRSWSVRDSAVSRASQLMFAWRHVPPLLVPALVPLLADRVPKVRSHTVAVVVDNGWPVLDLAVDALAEALADACARVDLDRVERRPQPSVHEPHARVVVGALAALAERGDARTLDPVRRLLRSNAVRLAWSRVLAGLGGYADALLPDVLFALQTADPSALSIFSRIDGLAAGVAEWGHDASPTVPVLMELLVSDRNGFIRRALVRVAPPDHPLRPDLVARVAGLLDDDNARGVAAVDYWRLTGDHIRTIQVLLDVISAGGSYALDELAELGPAATPALPYVRTALTEGSEYHRFCAAYAWWRVTSDPQFILPHLIATLHPNKIKPEHARMLGDIGQPAQPALPFLREVRDRLRRYSILGFNTTVRQDEDLRAAATTAIAQIEASMTGDA
jgi:HEAT repeat protein